MQMRFYVLFISYTLLGLCLALGVCAGQGEAAENPQGYQGYWTTVCATAYSPVDPIDGKYHATKGVKWRWISADGRTDVREDPYGVAVPLKGRRPALKFGTRIIVPVDTGYVAKSVRNRVFEVDDVGNGRQYFKKKNGCLHIDLRFKSHESAIQWAGPAGYRFIQVFIVTGAVYNEPVTYSAEDFRVPAR